MAVTARWMRTADMRSLGSFDTASQAKLKAGQPVKAGDGRTFQLMNGHLVSVGSPTWQAGLQIRQQGAARPAVPSVGAPKPTQDNPNPKDTTPTPNATVAPGAAPAPEAPATTTFDGDAFATIKAVLAEYGLESLAGWAKDSLIEGKSDAEVLLELRDRPEFKNEYSEIELRKAKGLPPLSVAEIINYRKNAAQLMRAAGLPQGFYDGKDDFTKFIAGDVSLSELNDRVQGAREAAYSAPAEVRAALREQYGVDDGGLTAFFLDPDRAQPLIEKQYSAAKIGGASFRTGYATTTAQREQLADLGVTAEQAQQGFGALAESSELFTPLNAGEDAIDVDEQLGAAFGGNAAATQKIEKRRSGRRAQFGGGGSLASSQQGVVGLGDTRR